MPVMSPASSVMSSTEAITPRSRFLARPLCVWPAGASILPCGAAPPRLEDAGGASERKGHAINKQTRAGGGGGGGRRPRPGGWLPTGDAAESEPAGDNPGRVRDGGAEAGAGVAVEGRGGVVRGAARDG